MSEAQPAVVEDKYEGPEIPAATDLTARLHALLLENLHKGEKKEGKRLENERGEYLSILVVGNTIEITFQTGTSPSDEITISFSVPPQGPIISRLCRDGAEWGQEDKSNELLAILNNFGISLEP